MASLVFGVIGAAIGAPFAGLLGMSGASLGWTIGSMLGGALFAPKQPTQFGPRLGDLKVQTSTYGNPIPVGWGSFRCAGNVIWSTPKLETAHSQTSGGKGGGGEVTQVSYTYSQSFAVAICAGEIAGIRRIWANGKLIYNLSDTADVATVVASNQQAVGIRFYTGSETQTADSLIQAYVGVANTPAYRGTAYVVFENLQLADYGNQMPNLEFEVVESGVVASSVSTISTVTCGNYAMQTSAYREFLVVPCKVINTVQVFSTNAATDPVLIASISAQAPNSSAVAGQWVYISSDNVPGYAINLALPYLPSITSLSVPGSPGTVSVAATGNYAFFITLSGTICVFNARTFQLKIATGAAIAQIACNTTHVYTVGAAGLVLRSIGNYNIISTTALTGTVADVKVVGTTAYVLTATHLYVYDCSVPTTPVLTDTVAHGGEVLTISGKYLFISSGGSNMYVIELSTLALLLTAGSPFEFMTQIGNYIYGTRRTTSLTKHAFYPRVITSSNTALSTLVSEICGHAGLTAADIDVTQLTDVIGGYLVQRGTARSWIEPLMQAYYFDAVESDGKIKFVKRGGSVATTIAEDDLAAHAYGSPMPENLGIELKQEMELPVEVNIQYMDTDGAYLINSQSSRRLTTESSNKLSVNLAMGLAGTKAKQIADVLMYDAWVSRSAFKLATSWKYAYLEPTDIVVVNKAGTAYTVRLIDEDSNGGVYQRAAVLEDISIYTQNAVAAPITAPEDTVSASPVTDLVLMDIPLLRDQDDGVGFYAAACGYSPGWYGAQPYKSTDGGASWNSFGRGMLNAATIGSASTALGDFYSGTIFDELNSVTVVLVNGTLSSDTELNVLNGANVALIGDEIVQFKNASLVATGKYTLTGLLRGRRGTEWAMSTHVIGDRFVLLTATTAYLLEGLSSEYNLSRHYRGVSFGGFLDDADTIELTNTAQALKPYAPVQLSGGRNAASDVVLKWVRRTRINGAWNDYTDVPLGEASEVYEVEIWNSLYTVLKRTITGIATQTTTYTAAQQTTDFGSPQATVYFKVFQVSATIGRGFEAKGQA